MPYVSSSVYDKKKTKKTRQANLLCVAATPDKIYHSENAASSFGAYWPLIHLLDSNSNYMWPLNLVGCGQKFFMHDCFPICNRIWFLYLREEATIFYKLILFPLKAKNIIDYLAPQVLLILQMWCHSHLAMTYRWLPEQCLSKTCNPTCNVNIKKAVIGMVI